MPLSLVSMLVHSVEHCHWSSAHAQTHRRAHQHAHQPLIGTVSALLLPSLTFAHGHGALLTAVVCLRRHSRSHVGTLLALVGTLTALLATLWSHWQSAQNSLRSPSCHNARAACTSLAHIIPAKSYRRNPPRMAQDHPCSLGRPTRTCHGARHAPLMPTDSRAKPF